MNVPHRLLACVVACLITTPLLGQSRSADSTKSGDLDTLLTYRARFHSHMADERKTVLEGNAEVRYRNMTLQAEKITVLWDDHLLIAEGKPDTVWEAVDGNPGDSVRVVRFRGEPIFREGSEELRGQRMVYNFKTRKGRVLRGRTEFEGGRYEGGTIKQEGEKTIWVAGGKYTTCELNEPHYLFASRQMKIVVNDKVIAKPVVLYLGKIPVAALPFAIFPHTRGRQSGLLIPHYGQSELEGRYLRGLGYYWAPNDYFDAKASIDFFERSGWMLHLNSNYAVRYLLRGSVSGSITRKNFAYGRNVRRWDLHISHAQTLDPTSSLQVSGYFVSDRNFYRDLSADLDQRLRRQLQSNATFSKNWTESKNSLTVNVSETRDLETGSVVRMLPQISFRHAQRRLFGAPRRRREARWYHSIYYAYNARAMNRVRRTEGLWSGGGSKVEHERFVSHSLRFSMVNPSKLFGWLQFSQGLNYQEDWFDEAKEYSWSEDEQRVVWEERRGFFARRTFSYNATLTTKLYGLFSPNLGPVEAIRHVVTPTVSFQYMPDFSDPRWGYYQTVLDPSGRQTRYDRFEGTPRGGYMSVRMGVQNLFQTKLSQGEKERKLDLFSWNISTSYNFRAATTRWSDIHSSVRTLFLRNVSLTLDAVHSLYEKTSGSSAPKYLWEHGGWKRGRFLRLEYVRLSTNLRLAGREKSAAPEPEEEQQEEGPTILLPGQTPRYEAGRPFEDFRVSWRANVSLNLELDRRYDVEKKRLYARLGGVEVQLTKNWRLAYSAHFDLAEREIVYQRVTLHRDLHCWEMEFDWVPSGRDKRYYLRINVKAPQLRELKVEKRGGRAGYLGYGSYYY